MSNLIKINYDNDRQTVGGRMLHGFLGVETRYNDWFARMVEYGFTEGIDFYSFLSKTQEGGRPSTDHQLTIEMAKEICMLQRTEKGKQARQYFIEIEKQWNSPEAVMSRALKMADAKLAEAQKFNGKLLLENAMKDQIINELQPKATYYDLILQSKSAISITQIAKDYGMSATKMNALLHELGVQFKQKDIWLLYQKYADKGYTSSKTHHYINSKDEQESKLHTYWTQKGRLFIYDLLKNERNLVPMMERE